MGAGATTLETQVAASISFALGLGTLFCCKACPRWAGKLKYPKRILFWMTVFDVIGAANYFYQGIGDPDGLACGFQAAVIQFFEVGAWIWMPCLAVDLFLLLAQPNVVVHGVNMMAARRHKIFHAVVWSFSVLSTITLLATERWGPAGDWCWWREPTDRIVSAYIFLWIGFVVIIGCSAGVLRLLCTLKALQKENAAMSRRSSGELSNVSILKLTNTQRVLLTPLLLILLHIPGTIRRSAEVAGMGDIPWAATLQTICDPSHGTINFFVWVAIDCDLHRELLEVFGCRPPGTYELRRSTITERATVTHSETGSLPRPSMNKA